LLITRETVFFDTPAIRAMSLIVTAVPSGGRPALLPRRADGFAGRGDVLRVMMRAARSGMASTPV
jgi:hypothetical protein